MPYNSVPKSFHKNKLCSRFSSNKVRFQKKTAVLRFWAPLWGLGATYDVHLSLIGKHVVDFLLLLTELGVRAEALWANTGWKSAFSLQCCQLDPKYQVYITNHFSCHKTRVNGLSSGIIMLAQLSSVLSQIKHLTDRQTYRQTDRQLSHR